MIRSLCVSVVLYSCAYASPIAQPQPQAVTAVIPPPQPPPPGCAGTFPGVFGIALTNISVPASPSETNPADKLRERQEVPPVPIFTMGAVSQIGDGQVQGGMHTTTITMSTTSMAPVSQIGDGQIQAPVVTAVSGTYATEASLVVAPTSNVPVPFPPRGSNQSATPTKPPTVLEQACGVSTRLNLSPTFPLPLPSPSPSSSSLQPSIPAPSSSSSTSPSSTNDSTTSITPSTSPTPSPSPRLSLVSCLTDSTLRLHLRDNNLYDAFNRTGYIASNYQFQFDGPPQSGAIWTSGWSICPVDTSNNNNDLSPRSSSSPTPAGETSTVEDNGIRTLALGGTTTFWQCLSGDFYNLYTENWAAQCSPVELRVVRLVDCGQ
ncbi:hypothetical protein AYO21_02444 [Fonsecaea monophora]|uniref:Cell wall mannoprotein PIR1-like C-terminal domain-containing protein n=1 Tax=Fonsecaea monophora TaxID=254056 RepID=A0A177FG20_9EURO|nr:hypothetical protein AYO21_02444 [Fonsecaea monophora]OAG43158.1 hypothetical protein AYO21_02444 [Fonsecaea monophora]